ncbi:MAG: hypothetical protein OES38_06540 [Gammaproteobacteria bacterium]|nr:hypothetical protein [Gammaproteobacteria bacterium]
MNNIVQFFKTSLLGGFFVLLPLVLLYLLLAEMVGLLVAMATPIADLFPEDTFKDVQLPGILAVVLLMGTSFLFGLSLRSANLRRLGLWMERATLGRLPIYGAVKRLSRGLIGAREDGVFKPAVLHSPNGEREIVYVIEDDGQGQVAVLVPWAPASFAGSVKIVNRDRVDLLKASLGDTSMVLSHWGVGAMKLLANEQVGKRKDSHE